MSDASLFFLFFSLFLGICNSERAAEAIIQVCTAGSPAIGLRFNAIRLDTSSTSTLASGSKTIKLNPCAVRVDIYNRELRRSSNVLSLEFHLFRPDEKVTESHVRFHLSSE